MPEGDWKDTRRIPEGSRKYPLYGGDLIFIVIFPCSPNEALTLIC